MPGRKVPHPHARLRLIQRGQASKCKPVELAFKHAQAKRHRLRRGPQEQRRRSLPPPDLDLGASGQEIIAINAHAVAGGGTAEEVTLGEAELDRHPGRMVMKKLPGHRLPFSRGGGHAARRQRPLPCYRGRQQGDPGYSEAARGRDDSTESVNQGADPTGELRLRRSMTGSDLS